MVPEKTNNRLMSKNDIDFVNGFDKLFETYMTAHSEFQIKNFIINDNDFPTASSKYHQCVRELHARRTNLINIQYQHNILSVDMQIDDINTSKIYDDDDNMEKLLISKATMKRNFDKQTLLRHQKQASEIIREMKVFAEIISSIIDEIPQEFKSEDGVPLREPSEFETWSSKGLLGVNPKQKPDILDIVANDGKGKFHPVLRIH